MSAMTTSSGSLVPIANQVNGLIVFLTEWREPLLKRLLTPLGWKLLDPQKPLPVGPRFFEGRGPRVGVVVPKVRDLCGPYPTPFFSWDSVGDWRR